MSKQMFVFLKKSIDKPNDCSYNKENKRSEHLFVNMEGIMENYLSYKERLEISKRRRAEQLRRRLVMTFLIVLVFASTVLAITQRASADTIETRRKTCTSVEVQPGDTLWSIAESYYTEECVDICAYIDEIKKTNNLYDDKIVSGNYLIVPYYKACAE